MTSQPVSHAGILARHPVLSDLNDNHVLEGFGLIVVKTRQCAVPHGPSHQVRLYKQADATGVDPQWAGLGIDFFLDVLNYGLGHRQVVLAGGKQHQETIFVGGNGVAKRILSHG